MEKALRLLFDYQRFVQDEALSSCIESTESRCLFQGIHLDDDMLELNAAGDPCIDKNFNSNFDAIDPIKDPFS